MNTAATPRVVVTRPAAQAGAWVARLAGAGIEAIALPLIAIEPASDAAAVAAAWRSLPSCRLVVFVSANAVQHFFAAKPADFAWPPGVIAAAPGPGTGDALRTAGVAAAAVLEPAADAASFDSESLWLRLHERDWRGAEVLVVRGDGGRDWLVERLVEAGANVTAVAAYRRLPPAFDAAARATLEALAGDAAAVWLFSSSQAVDHLEQIAGTARWAASRAIASHPRIAARARQAGFGRVVEAGPGFEALVACIQSIGP